MNLVLIPGFEVFALRDFGLLLAVLALAPLAPIVRRDTVGDSKGSAS